MSTRLGIQQILREGFPHPVFGAAGTAVETVAHLEQAGWDLVILDISLPDNIGLELLRTILNRWPGQRVLIYSAHSEDQFAAHSLRAGAAGYLTKERAPEELCEAVRTILAGDRYLSPSLLARLSPEQLTERPGLPHEALSERELQVLRLLARGLPGKTIAAELGLSQKTVSTYRTRILRKFQFGSVAELVQYAVRHGLV